ncbi:MAG: hypothetical protein MPEBLZ_01810 [Candidatus Methanoperedens nitroreducens]|uniref:Uncharacterized protein n=1 Tax=Candidatus Methanoperedens nitratireducens TaxID=1392998 RepID=A0A0N8KR09_9EURY|nr:MAG: hypothetical protein MPEBLZ_01810 [Candidatus Methanoperedens sp. BLZ1]
MKTKKSYKDLLNPDYFEPLSLDDDGKIFTFGALIIGYSSTLFIKIISFTRCNLYLMNGINLLLINKTVLLSKNLIYKYGIKKAV